jgi:hypothetical protein
MLDDPHAIVRHGKVQTEHDVSFDTRTVKKGEVQLLNPGLLRVDWQTSPQPTILLITRQSIHFFHPERKEMIWKKPADGRFFAETPTRSFLEGLARFGEAFQQQAYWEFAGLPVRELTPRFDLRLTKEDAWYVYLDIQPRHPQDKSAFNRMRVVLQKDSFRVRQIWYEQITGNTLTLDFKKPNTNVKITPESIREGLPQGWERIDLVESLKSMREK